jgi:protein farnesyltransferase/geranylgeranyltransferase type-1 subunit alpha
MVSPGISQAFITDLNARQYRYETLLAINAPLDVELRLMDELAIKFLKTYQVWHHRQLIVTLTRKPRVELDFIAKALSEEDQKNYHTWSYRQWLLSYFNDEEDLWSKELDFVDVMLTKDVRNNSAWHHRFFVVWASGVRDGEEDRERVLRRELMYGPEFVQVPLY